MRNMQAACFHAHNVRPAYPGAIRSGPQASFSELRPCNRSVIRSRRKNALNLEKLPYFSACRVRAHPDALPCARCHGPSMQKIKNAASEFLAYKRVAVTGVSRQPRGTMGRTSSTSACAREATRCSRSTRTRTRWKAIPVTTMRSILGGVEAVVIGTSPRHADETMRECADLGIKHVWMHRGPGGGSVSETAAEYGRAHGIAVIDGGCPCMFGPTSDPGHKAMRFVLTISGNVPRRV